MDFLSDYDSDEKDCKKIKLLEEGEIDSDSDVQELPLFTLPTIGSVSSTSVKDDLVVINNEKEAEEIKDAVESRDFDLEEEDEDVPVFTLPSKPNSLPPSQAIVNEKSIAVKRGGLCQECNVEKWKYTCPRCQMKTCSLNCSKSHKDRLDCDGKRSRTHFVPLSHFKDEDLYSDLSFLAQGVRQVNSCINEEQKKISNFKKSWKNALLKHYSIEILIMPSELSRSKNNKSRLKQKSFLWTIEFKFQLTDKPYTCLIDFIDGNSTMNEVLSKYFDAEEQTNVHNFAAALWIKERKLCNLQVYFLDQKTKEKVVLFDFDACFMEIFRGHSMIEYPTLFIGPKE